jgi:hypothetical protein
MISLVLQQAEDAANCGCEPRSGGCELRFGDFAYKISTGKEAEASSDSTQVDGITSS